MGRKKNMDPDDFWKQYETGLGEKVLSYTLGQYLSGWPEYASPLWGLLIATSGGFRFHHFPHESWIVAISRLSSGGAAPKEKTIFIPRDRIRQAELRIEKSVLKKIFLASSPRFVLRYVDNAGIESEFVAETDSKAFFIVENLQKP
ncbi:MAG: hypothetical protein LBB68_11295 [Treponema sp.]|jgi:hypothetical protein|nr:hypothetical protein [Treponema sp.]